MLQRARLVALHAEGLYSVADLARRFGVSRKTAYKWIARYRAGGADALADRSHVARGHPAKTPPEIEALVVEARYKHPTWGPRKLVPWIAKRHPGARLPAASTVGTILKRHGLVEPRRRRRVAAHPGSRPLVADAPGDVWTADCARIRALKGSSRPATASTATRSRSATRTRATSWRVTGTSPSSSTAR